MKPIRVFNHTLHKAMWNWLAENPDKDKNEWSGIKDLGDFERRMFFTHYCCFACIATGHHYRMSLDSKMREACIHCPLQWEVGIDKNELALCVSKTAQYYKFKEVQYAENYELASKLAREIANLPIREPEDIALVVI